MLPFTTRVAPRSRSADAGSCTFRARTTLAGTTHRELLAASRLESRLERLSIRPSAIAVLAGSFPMLSKGSTAICFSFCATNLRVSCCRTEGTNDSAVARISRPAIPETHQCHDRCGATPQADRDACSSDLRKSRLPRVLVGLTVAADEWDVACACSVVSSESISWQCW